MSLLASSLKKVHLISLGCARNRVDSEVMLGALIDDHWTVTDEAEDADAVVINTCGFIDAAKEESVQTILEAAELKKAKPGMKVVVAGCLTQRYKSKLASDLPEVDVFIGTDEFPKIATYINEDYDSKNRLFAKRTHYLYDGELPKKNTLGKASAYVKVAEGCQHNCAFCIIPAIRGKLRSRPIPNVISEVKSLVAQGVKEVNLIAQDLAAYGRDWGSSDLLELLRQLEGIEGLDWIRPLYVYPENISPEFVLFLKNSPKVVKYLDIPVQHASDRVLTAMNRDVTAAQLRAQLNDLRNHIPGLAIRTSVMVGFPGETEEDFQMLYDFVKEMRFDHLGCFTYSKEEGTVAGRMDGQISDDVKRERQKKIMELQQSISRSKLQEYVGKVVSVLVEGVSGESELLGQGRLSTQAPEVDGIVYINDGPYKAGEIQKVLITEAHEYDLVGAVLTSEEEHSVVDPRT